MKAVLIGAADSVADVAASLQSASDGRVEIVGAVTTDGGSAPLWTGTPVLGAALTRDTIKHAINPPDAVIWCAPVEDRAAARDLLDRVSALRLRPIVAEHEDGALVLRPMRLEDLLGKAASRADVARVRDAIAGRRVLITGGGGSIGAELVRQIAALKPARITILENSEFNLYSIDHALAAAASDVPRAIALCDIRSPRALERWFARERPELVFHVAALKQVPLVEAHACEGVLTNVMGTRNVAAACAQAGAHMVLVSTDKAVNPSSVMGATKRIAELYCQALDRRALEAAAPRFLTARLGNVLGSAGSVSPLFERQLAEGGPLTVTHAQVARFFITIPQAAAFLLEACALGLARPEMRGVAHVLDMGEAVRVVDLARDMIRLKGLRPDEDVDIKFVGLRPGEKLTEQLIGDEEWVDGHVGARIMAVHGPPRDLSSLEIEIDGLIRMAKSGRDDLVKAGLWRFVGASDQDSAAATA